MGVISLTPELIRDIFDEFPDVHLAWKQNVPKVRVPLRSALEPAPSP